MRQLCFHEYIPRTSLLITASGVTGSTIQFVVMQDALDITTYPAIHKILWVDITMLPPCHPDLSKTYLHVSVEGGRHVTELELHAHRWLSRIALTKSRPLSSVIEESLW